MYRRGNTEDETWTTFVLDSTEGEQRLIDAMSEARGEEGRKDLGNLRDALREANLETVAGGAASLRIRPGYPRYSRAANRVRRPTR